MNKKNITLDLSHLSYESFWCAINATKLIPIATHSNSFFIRRHRRNLTVSQLQAISNKGGTTGLVLYNDFIAKKSKVTMDDLYKQFKYLLSKCGEDHVALGSDIDGAPINDFPIGIRKSSDLYSIIKMLERKKVSSRIIDKFAGIPFKISNFFIINFETSSHQLNDHQLLQQLPLLDSQDGFCLLFLGVLQSFDLM